MTVSYSRGHKIEYTPLTGWVYADTSEPYADNRSCALCGLSCVPGGPDPCLGMLPYVASACCGHGITVPYLFATGKGSIS